MTAGLNFEVAGVALSTSLTPIPASSYQTGGPVPDFRGSEAASSPVGKVWCAEAFPLGARKAKFPEELPEDLTERFFPKPRQGWECRRSKPPTQHPDFRHKKSRVPLWLKHQPKPVNVDSQLATIDDVVKQTGCNSVQRSGAPRLTAGHVNVRMCRELCDSGLTHDAVEALNLLVQRGCPVSNNLFYRLLKGCIKDVDLALGRRVHALTVRSGYEGDAFLATHLISFYALHGRLEDAMGVFTKVSTPSVYNWATIIFAYARHGEAAEAAKAVTLYRQMCESTTIHPDDRLYTAVLKACASAKDLVVGKEIHARILSSSRKPDPFVEAALVNMYAKCGSVGDARELFDQLSDRNVVTWTAMIAGYAQQGMGQEALSLHRRMRQEGLTPPNCVTYACLLQACATIGASALREGQQLHAEIEKQGLQDDVVVGGSLVNMYAKCGSIGDARSLFDKLLSKNVVTWTAMISGYAQEGMARGAISMYRSMRQEGLTPPDSVTYVCLLQACASVGVGALDEGKQLHAHIRERGLQEDVVLGGSLVNMYAKCGKLEEAWSVFDKLSNRGVVTWTAMIAGYVQQGMGQEALSLYRSMRKEGLTPNSVTCVCLLQACASIGLEALDEGKQLHTEIKNQGLEEDVVVGGSLVNLYSKCGNLDVARSLFDRLPDRNVVAWNAMIAGYAQQGMGHEALSLSKGMRQEGLCPDCVTYVSLLQACSGVGAGAYDEGKQLHAEIREQGLQEDVIVGSSLINMYAKCGSLEEAQKVFDNLSNRDAVTWTAMIAAYAEQRMGREALTLYQSMQDDGFTPISSTYVCLLQACASVGEEGMREGKQLHAEIEEQGLEKDAAVGSSLVNMYAKCGRVEEAQIVFDKLPNRDVVTWTTMIAGYAQQGMSHDALSLYKCMQQQGLTPDPVTYVCLLEASAALAALPLGEQLHNEIEERGMQVDGIVGAALVNMYAKCGSMYDSQRVFDSLSDRSIEAWGALVGGYARQGDCQVVFELLDRMRVDGIQPNDITLLSVLTVCSHAGLVDKGREYFTNMRTIYGVSATMEHYMCMVDLLGRAGHLEEALQIARTMPFPPNDVVWRTLLGACQKWKNVEIGQQAFQNAVSVDRQDAAAYVLMSNIYASRQMWEASMKLQTNRVKVGAWKKPGQSWWTDMSGVVHTFAVGDKKHPESEGIYARLEQLIPRMKKEGYVPHLESSLLDIPGDEKQAKLCEHSEKLAIAYALNKTQEGTTIRIAKNLRVCEDCHTATAFISIIEKRAIICRDASRFHVFKEGECVCGGYW